MNVNIHHIPLGVYIPGQSPVHRISAGAKLTALVAILVAAHVFVGATSSTTGAVFGALFTLVSLGGYVLARIPGRVARGQLLSPVPLIVFFGAFLVWRTGLVPALATILTLYASVVLATLLTLTTPVSAMMDAIDKVLRPFERFGLPVDGITFAFSLCIRLIPLIFMTAIEVLEAQKARGITGLLNTVNSFGVPLIVRCLVRAKALGEAMLSRGLGD